MKKIILIFVILNFANFSFSEDEMGESELLIKNLSGDIIKIVVSPVGSIFSTKRILTNIFKRYSPDANPGGYPSDRLYITGGFKVLTVNDNILKINFDGEAFDPECLFNVGYGLYKIDFYHFDNGYWELGNTCYMDWRDSYYPLYPNISLTNDVKIYIYSISDIKFQFFGGSCSTDFIPIDSIEKHIKIWEQATRFTCSNIFTPTNGPFITDSLHLNNWPINGALFPNFVGVEIPHINYGSLSLFLEIQNNHYAKINTTIPFVVEDSAKLKLKYSETYQSNARLYVQNNAEFRVKPTGTIDIDKYGNLILESGGKMYMENNSNTIFHDHGEIIINSEGTLYNCGATITNSSSACIIVHNGGNYFIGSQYCIPSVTHTLNNGAFLVVDGGTLIIGDSSKIIFDGPTSFLKINPNSNIKLGLNARIEFKNGAYLKANGTIFTSLDSTKQWEGIILSNSGIDSISNCTFSRTKTALTFISDTSSSFVGRVIKNNTFNIPAGDGNKGIYGVNNFRITIENNVFNMPSNPASHVFGVYLKSNNTQGNSSVTSITENQTPLSQYSIYILNNSFYNGTASVILANYTSSYLPVFVKGNYLASASLIGILGRNISGTLSDNRILNYSIPMGIHLVASSPALYNNSLSTANVTLHTIGSSYPDLSPAIVGTRKMWNAGRNNLSSLNSDNIQLVTRGNADVNLGENKFTINTTNNYHIYGYVDSSVNKFFARKNCWNSGNLAKIYLRKNTTSDPIMFETGYTLGCGSHPPAEESGIYYLGNGLFDTLQVNSDTTGSYLTDEELLYNQGKNYKNASMFTAGISSLKDLINSYNYFDDLPASVYDLYSCYEYLDTNSNQNFRNTLYSNLKDYLDSKIYNEGDYDASFISNAYNITVMCESNMLNYDNAANAYEFIALYHPDPDVRLNASWDYAEVEALMGGGNGGGVRNLGIGISDLELTKLKEINEVKRINEIISNDPIMIIMKAVYEKISKERLEKNERTEKQINESIKTNEKSNEIGNENILKSEQLQKQNESDKFINEKAKRNLFELKNLSKQELEKRRIEDMFLSAKDNRDLVDGKSQTLSIPKDFKLHQNYPNPFNPATTIKFDLPKDGLVNFKIYDILGKEVYSFNEVKQAGYQQINFNGSNLSSGIYLYKIEYLNFVQTKRMVLIK